MTGGDRTYPWSCITDHVTFPGCGRCGPCRQALVAGWRAQATAAAVPDRPDEPLCTCMGSAVGPHTHEPAVPDRAAPTEPLVPCLTCGVEPEHCAATFVETLGRDCCDDCNHTRPDVRKVPWEPAAPTEEAGEGPGVHEIGALRDRTLALKAETEILADSAERQARVNDAQTALIADLRAERDALRDTVRALIDEFGRCVPPNDCRRCAVVAAARAALVPPSPGDGEPGA